jgi:hypothetical protein
MEKTTERRTLLSALLTNYYSGDNIKNLMGWTCGTCVGEERRGGYRVLVGRCEGRRSLGRPRLRWEDNIKMDIKDVGWGS